LETWWRALEWRMLAYFKAILYSICSFYKKIFPYNCIKIKSGSPDIVFFFLSGKDEFIYISLKIYSDLDCKPFVWSGAWQKRLCSHHWLGRFWKPW
jgi:hypothetical protein